MRFFYSAASFVLACGLAVSPFALAAHRHKSSHRVTHHVTVRAGHHPESTSSKTADESVKRHRAEHARHSSVHEVAHHSTRHSKRIAEHRELRHSRHTTERRAASHRTVRHSRHTLVRVAATEPKAVPQAGPEARPEAESRNLAETIPPIPMRGGHLYVPPPLVGSHASLVRQNERGEAEGLKRIQDVAQLNAMRQDGKLVPLPVGKSLRANPDLPVDRRCTRPWTAKFLTNLAHAHYVRFDRPLQVNSAVRTVKFQRRLIRVNGNAAPATGEIASPHLMGATIDIGKRGLSLSEIAWMRAYLLPLEQDGKIDVEEEFYQSCFHITVYKSYLPRTKRTNKKTRRTPAALLATGVR